MKIILELNSSNEMLKTFLPLKELNMNNTNLSVDSIQDSSESLYQSSFLKTLNLGNNMIGEKNGLDELLKKITFSKSISILGLGQLKKNRMI